MYPKILNRIGKGCALAAALTLPVLAYADSGKGNKGDQEKDRKAPVVPEASTGWVLIPFFGAVLLYSWRRARAKA
jgi:hypothetical protein